jgi:hypothetical protein
MFQIDMTFDKRSFLSVIAVLALASSGCGLSSDIDGVFSDGGASNSGGSNPGGAAGSGPGGAGVAGANPSTGGSSSTDAGGSSAGGSSAGGSSSGGSSSGGSGGGGPEDCLDGVDNDGDGDADCADSECKPDFQCVTAVPSGYKGYFEVNRTDYPTPPGACDGGGMPAVYFSGPAGPPECNACTCGDVQGATCSAAPLSCWAGSGSCNGTATDWTATLADGQCKKPGNLVGGSFSLSCQVVGDSQITGKGSCEPSKTDFANKNLWQNEVGACGLPAAGKGCGDGQACVPKVQGGDGGKLCIQKDGDTLCPAGTFSQKVATFTGGTDNRTCGDCTCGDASAMCGAGTYTFYDADQCGNMGDNPATIADMCRNVGPLLDFNSWSIRANIPKAQGTCPPGGGEPKGEVQTDGPVTFCCQP